MKSDLSKSLECFGVDDLSAQKGWSRLASENKKRFEKQWKVLQLRELEFYSLKSGFIHEVVTKMAAAFRFSWLSASFSLKSSFLNICRFINVKEASFDYK